MKEKLAKLYNTMNMIETKGRNTKIMAECLEYLERLIKDEQKKEEQQKILDSLPVNHRYEEYYYQRIYGKTCRDFLINKGGFSILVYMLTHFRNNNNKKE